MGWGRDETVEASDATAAQLRTAKDTGALERAALPAEGGLSGAATRLVERLLDVGIDGKGPFDSAHEVAKGALEAAGATATSRCAPSSATTASSAPSAASQPASAASSRCRSPCPPTSWSSTSWPRA